jgi:hypothetical protein
MEVQLDGQRVQTIVVEPSRRVYQVGPLTVPPAEHALVFHPAARPGVAGEVTDNRDPRRLSFAFATWTWSVREERR